MVNHIDQRVSRPKRSNTESRQKAKSFFLFLSSFEHLSWFVFLCNAAQLATLCDQTENNEVEFKPIGWGRSAIRARGGWDLVEAWGSDWPARSPRNAQERTITVHKRGVARQLACAAWEQTHGWLMTPLVCFFFPLRRAVWCPPGPSQTLGKSHIIPRPPAEQCHDQPRSSLLY